MADGETKNPFEGFKTDASLDGIPVEAKAAEPAKGGKPSAKGGESDQDDETDPLAAFGDSAEEEDQGDDELQDEDDGGDGSAEDDDESGASEEDDDEEDDDSEEDDDGGDSVEARARELAKKMAQKRMGELTKRRREAERENAELKARLDRLEQQRAAPDTKDQSDNSPKDQPSDDAPDVVVKDPNGKTLEAPDPKKYKYGEVDSAYLKDVVNYQTAYARAVVQHEAEQTRQAEAAEQHVQELRKSWDTVQKDGLARYDDFEETVLAAGDRGDYDLTQATFEMAAASEFGADILYHLAKNPKTASSVAKMNERDQARYLGRLEAAIETSRKSGDKGKQKRKAPGASPPPSRKTPRGRGGKFVNPGKSESFADFEAAVKRAEQKRGR